MAHLFAMACSTTMVTFQLNQWTHKEKKANIKKTKRTESVRMSQTITAMLLVHNYQTPPPSTTFVSLVSCFTKMPFPVFSMFALWAKLTNSLIFFSNSVLFYFLFKHFRHVPLDICLSSPDTSQMSMSKKNFLSSLYHLSVVWDWTFQFVLKIDATLWLAHITSNEDSRIFHSTSKKMAN